MSDTRRPTSRALLDVAIRSLASVVVVLVAYYTTPLRVDTEAETLVRFTLIVVALLVIIAWQVRGILRAANPWLRAIEALSVTVTIAVVAFALVYLVLSRDDVSAFSEDLTRTDSLYFTLSTLATVGYGEIHARTETARVVVMLQMVFNVAVIGAGVRLIVGAARRGAHSRDAEEGLAGQIPESEVGA